MAEPKRVSLDLLADPKEVRVSLDPGCCAAPLIAAKLKRAGCDDLAGEDVSSRHGRLFVCQLSSHGRAASGTCQELAAACTCQFQVTGHCNTSPATFFAAVAAVAATVAWLSAQHSSSQPEYNGFKFTSVTGSCGYAIAIGNGRRDGMRGWVQTR